MPARAEHRGVRPVAVVPGSPTHAAWVRRILDDRVTVVSSAGAVRYRLATVLPAGRADGPALQAAIDRLQGADRPVLRATKG